MSIEMFNLHNKTPFSDGAYTVDEICEAHLDADFPVAGIGIADHLFCTPSSREVQNEKDFDRIFGKEARSYVQMVREARQKWGDKLQIFCGAEISWPLNKNMLEPIRRSLSGIDYVYFEFVDWAGLTTLANQARRWPCPVILAHTDIAAQFPNTSMDQVVRTLANARIVYELSARLKPLGAHQRWLKTLPNHRVQIAIGTDTHDDLSVIQDLPELYACVQEYKLIDKIFVPQPKAAEAVSAAR